MSQIIIIGGGLAGVTAALHLAERGLSPLILEAEPDYAGGRAAGGKMVEVGSHHFRVEHGIHGIWSPYRNLQALLSRHRLRPAFVPAQEETWIYKRNDSVKRANIGSSLRRSWFPAPLHYLGLFARPHFLRILGLRSLFSLPMVWYSLILAVGIDPIAEKQPLDGLYLSDFMKGWSQPIKSFCMGLARNGLSAQPDEVPLSGFIAFLRYYTLLRRDSWGFSYLPADSGTVLVEPLVEKLEIFGGEMRLGTAVTHITSASSGWIVHTSDGQSLSAEQLILAVDSASAATLIENSTLEGRGGLYWPDSRETAVVRLWFNRTPNPSSSAEGGMFSGDFIIDNFFWLHRLQDQYRQWHNDTGGSAIEVHIYGPPELLKQSDLQILAQAIGDIHAAFPEMRGHIVHKQLQRNPIPHTLFGVGAADKHLGVKTSWNNLYCCGDWVYHPTPSFFMERAIVTGIEAANKVLERHHLKPYPLVEDFPPEPFAAFLQKLMKKGRHIRRKY